MEYLNRLISVLNLAQKDIGNRMKGFASASYYLEIWDNSDSITAVNAQKIWDILQNGGITTQQHNIKVLRPTMNTRKYWKPNWDMNPSIL